MTVLKPNDLEASVLTGIGAFDLVEMNPHFMFFTAVQEGFYLKHGSAECLPAAGCRPSRWRRRHARGRRRPQR